MQLPIIRKHDCWNVKIKKVAHHKQNKYSYLSILIFDKQKMFFIKHYFSHHLLTTFHIINSKISMIYNYQSHNKTPFKLKIKDLLNNFAKQENANVSISAFKLFILGEGIEKKELDFANEVASITGNINS